MNKLINIVLSYITVLLLLLVAGSTSQLVYLPHTRHQVKSANLGHSYKLSEKHQQPFIIAESANMDKGGVGALTLSDVISIHREIGVFIDTLLSVDEAGSRLEDGAQNTTVLAPTNTVMRHLSRKPWQDPRDAEEADTQGVSQDDLYAGDAGEDRASQNLRRFVQAHLVEVSPWQKGKENMAKTLGGKSVWWDEEGGVRKIYPDGIEVEEVKDERSNGQIWVIKGVMNY